MARSQACQSDSVGPFATAQLGPLAVKIVILTRQLSTLRQRLTFSLSLPS